MQSPQFKKGQVLAILSEQIRIVNVYPPGHRYGAQIGSNTFYYHIHSSEIGSDVWREDLLLEMIREFGALTIKNNTNQYQLTL
jgi:hypothetical protein